MEQASEDTLDDLTAGSTLYYAPYSLQDAGAIDLPNGNSISFPRGWNPAAVAYQAKIGNQVSSGKSLQPELRQKARSRIVAERKSGAFGLRFCLPENNA